MRFLRLNQIDTYNHEMGNVDIADQLRAMYRIDHWLRNRKWWLAILFWAIGVIFSNSYVLYTTICDKEEVKKKLRLTHYEFLAEIGTYWMNPLLAEQEYGRTDLSKDVMSPSASTVSTLTTDSSVSKGKPYMNDASLGPNRT